MLHKTTTVPMNTTIAYIDRYCHIYYQYDIFISVVLDLSYKDWYTTQIGVDSLLQIGASVVTNWGSYYKLGQPFLRNRAAITNWSKISRKNGKNSCWKKLRAFFRILDPHSSRLNRQRVVISRKIVSSLLEFALFES